MPGRGKAPPVIGNADSSGSKRSILRARLSGEDRGGFTCWEGETFVPWGESHLCRADGETEGEAS